MEQDKAKKKLYHDGCHYHDQHQKLRKRHE